MDEPGRVAIDRAFRGERVLEHFDFHLRRADGLIAICETRVTTDSHALQGVSRDVTELRQLQETLAQLALRDPLTGLANRRLLDELLEAELAPTQRSGTPLAVAYVDLDGLKQVNDTHGHDAGDAVLRETARRLVSIVGDADVVARIGGDEFVIVYNPNDTQRQRPRRPHRRTPVDTDRDQRRDHPDLPCQHRHRRHAHGRPRPRSPAGGRR